MNDAYREAATQLVNHFLMVTNTAEYPFLIVGERDDQVVTQCFYATCFIDVSSKRYASNTLSIFHNYGEGGCVTPELDSGLYRFSLDIDIAKRLLNIKEKRDLNRELNEFSSSVNYTLKMRKHEENGKVVFTLFDAQVLSRIPEMNIICNDDGSQIKLIAKLEGRKPLVIPMSHLSTGSAVIKHVLLSGLNKEEVFTHLQEISALSKLAKEPAYFADVHFQMLNAKLSSEKASELGVYRSPYEYAGGYSTDPRNELSGLFKIIDVFNSAKEAEPEQIVDAEYEDSELYRPGP